MCISAPISFTVSAALAAIGVATIRKAMLYDRRMLVFSLFPAIFSFHQFTEGMVWLSLSGAVDGKFYSYAYIFVAVLVWPILTPLASALAETDPDMKRHRYAFFGAALVVLGYLVFKLVNASGLDVKVVDHSLSYVIKYDTEPPAYAEYVYAAATLLPLLDSEQLRAQIDRRPRRRDFSIRGHGERRGLVLGVVSLCCDLQHAAISCDQRSRGRVGCRRGGLKAHMGAAVSL